ncbi:hypothetical protein SRHO_G00118690 [Serrasalmus rhombeus]
MLRKQQKLKPLMLAEVSSDSTVCGPTVCKSGYFFPDIQGKEPKPVVTLPTRFSLLCLKVSARNSAVCRGLPSRTRTSTKPPVNPQVLKVLGAGPKKEKPDEDGEAVLTKPHPPKGKSRPMKSMLLQVVAPVRKLKESSLDLTVKGAIFAPDSERSVVLNVEMQNLWESVYKKK